MLCIDAGVALHTKQPGTAVPMFAVLRLYRIESPMDDFQYFGCVRLLFKKLALCLTDGHPWCAKSSKVAYTKYALSSLICLLGWFCMEHVYVFDMFLGSFKLHTKSLEIRSCWVGLMGRKLQNMLNISPNAPNTSLKTSSLYGMKQQYFRLS